ncbi:MULTISPECIES: TadE family type IV pilus minor pilin [unclassified Frankia]|uniref:TadE family type IV pilus minor pilin n=1 Tax=unclassified Frankia TaxID=2632575 RepID=UPI0027DDE8C4|nr:MULTISPECIES: TadE family type IV pilus minor pilin [unclassified Frankia]
MANERGRPDPAQRASPRGSRRPDRGQATAELALGLPTLGAVIIVALWLLAAVGAQARVDEAARIGARAAARGEADGQVVAWVRGAAPSGATVEIAHRDDQVAVTVHYRLAAAGPLVTPIALTATATAPSEQAIADAASADVATPARADAAPPPPDDENRR